MKTHYTSMSCYFIKKGVTDRRFVQQRTKIEKEFFSQQAGFMESHLFKAHEDGMWIELQQWKDEKSYRNANKRFADTIEEEKLIQFIGTEFASERRLIEWNHLKK